MAAKPTQDGVLELAAVVPLGHAEAPAALSRALEMCRHAVTVRPPIAELLRSSLVVFVGRDALIADAVASLRGSPRGALLSILALVDGEAKSPWLDPSWAAAVDAALPLDAGPAMLASALERLGRIAGAVGQLPPESIGVADAEKRRVRILRWIATRELEWLEPSRGAGSASLHRWGALEAIAGAHAASDLAGLVKAGMLRAEAVDRVYRCACGDARLHFRDACEGCRSTRLEIAHTLRHKSCGHVAASSAFWRGEELACPKCGLELKTAGEDYDGPHDEARCAACGGFSREGLTIATCLGCGTTADAESLKATPVERYALTESGRVALLATPGDGRNAPVEDEERRAGLVAAWKKLAAQGGGAGAGRARGGKPSALVRYTSVAASGAALDEMIGAALRGSDHAARLGANSFLALLADTGADGARRFVDRITTAERALCPEGVVPLVPATQVLIWPDDSEAIDRAVRVLAPANGGPR